MPARALALTVILAVMLGACSAPTSPVAVEGRITVIGPDGSDRAAARPTILGAATTTIGDDDGVLALHVASGAGGSAIGRRLDSPLLALPYLNWGWRRGPDNPADAVPIRVRVGFNGADVFERVAPTPPWLASLARALPPADRYVDLVWHSGSITPGLWIETGGVPGLVMRNASTARESWQIEAVDLATIHARLWPNARRGETTVAWVFVMVAPGTRSSLAELVISR
ncbi:MAG: hypothetical protein U1E97_06445 [Alphaproteobacteria bacterium]